MACNTLFYEVLFSGFSYRGSQEEVDVKEEAEKMEDEIIPIELELYKPREVEDVLEDLKSSDKTFEIFLDNENKTRVLFKMGNKRFGLY